MNAHFTLVPLGADADAAWDALAGDAPESGYMQSSAWAAFKRSEGYQTARVGFCADERLFGGATLYSYPASAASAREQNPQNGFVLCPEGPVLPWHDRERARACLRALTAYVQTLPADAIGFRIEPHLSPPAPSLLRNWSRAPVDLTATHTLLLDLRLTDDDLLAQMHPKGRYNLGLSRRHGVQVRRSTQPHDLARFYTLFLETAERNDFFAEPYGFFLNLGTAFFPAEHAALYFAEWNGETLGAILVLFYGHRATYLYGGSSAQNRRVMPNYALHWTALQEARQRGCREYDFYGYDPFGLPDHLYAGISRFKKQWGGFRRDGIGARDLLFYDRLADRLIPHLDALPTS